MQCEEGEPFLPGDHLYVIDKYSLKIYLKKNKKTLTLQNEPRYTASGQKWSKVDKKGFSGRTRVILLIFANRAWMMVKQDAERGCDRPGKKESPAG